MNLPEHTQHQLPDAIAACSGKKRFPNGAEAHRLARDMATRAKRGGRRKRGDVHVYRCPFCNGWHLGRAVAVGKT